MGVFEMALGDVVSSTFLSILSISSLLMGDSSIRMGVLVGD